jgi:hypothetical protein
MSLNDGKIADYDLETFWKEVVVAYYTVITRKPEKIHGDASSCSVTATPFRLPSRNV